MNEIEKIFYATQHSKVKKIVITVVDCYCYFRILLQVHLFKKHFVDLARKQEIIGIIIYEAKSDTE